MSTIISVDKQFILGGRAIFSVHNPKGQQYTFKVTRKDHFNGGNIYFVKLMYGPDNENDFRYLGILNPLKGTIRLTQKSKFTYDSMAVKVLQWALKNIWMNRELPEGYGINSNGYCARCGRMLTRHEGTDPEGHRYGFGPHCWKLVNGETV